MQQSVSLSTTKNVSEGYSGELNEKCRILKELSKELEKIETRFYQAITKSSAKESESQQDSDTTRDEELGQVQEQGTTQLDYILGTATSLKEIGYEINEEIGVHCRLLEEIEDREDQIFAKHNKNEKLFQDWTKSKGSSLVCLWGIVIFLFITFIYVLML